MKALVLGLVLVSCGSTQAATPSPTPQVVYVSTPVRETHPTFSQWSKTVSLGAGQYTALPLADTFTVHIQFEATAPVRASIMTLDQFSKFATAGTRLGTTYPPSAAFDLTFHDSEGCAAYVLVLDATEDTVIGPNVTVTYAPAQAPTGVCAN